MIYRTYMVIKDCSEDKSKDTHGSHHETENKSSKVIGISDDIAHQLKGGIKDYLDENGYHFNNTLAEFASRQMVNANGQKHSWTVERVKSLMATHGMELPEDSTYGDITYAANMGYADFYPEVLKDEVSCLKFAHAMASDPDGYDGLIFKRWCKDMVEKHLHIDWMKYL